MTTVIVHQAGITELVMIPVRRYGEGLADRVVARAQVKASGRPGPRIRTGNLVEQTRKESTVGSGTWEIQVGSEAVSPRQNYPYPGRLETGEDGPHYPWLEPALRQVFTTAP